MKNIFFFLVIFCDIFTLYSAQSAESKKARPLSYSNSIIIKFSLISTF